MDAKIEEGNILIETFKGERELMPNSKQFGIKRGSPKEYENWYNIINVSELKYHSSWDCLMPVIKNIHSIVNDGHKVSEKESWLWCEIMNAVIDVYIYNSFECVTHYLTYYNQNQITNQ